MIRIRLTDLQRSELQSLRRSDLAAVASDRLEMVLRSDAGWSPPRIAGHLGRHAHTVRAALHGYAAHGTDAFDPDQPGPEPDHARRADITAKLAGLLGQDRTWTSRQLADALSAGIGHRQTRRYLGLLKAGYRRTAQTVSHKQDPKKAQRAGRVLDSLKKSGGRPPETIRPRRVRLHPVPTGLLQLVPARPTQAGAVRVSAGPARQHPGDRRAVRQNPGAGRRRLRADAHLDDLVACLRERLPPSELPRVVVLDNAGIHTSKSVKAARPGLRDLGIYLYYLPAYSPELNRIEPVFKQVKHHDMPVRSYTSKDHLRHAVEAPASAPSGDASPRNVIRNYG
jgi:putative transposase